MLKLDQRKENKKLKKPANEMKRKEKEMKE